MASDEVVQLYLTHVGVAGAPRRTLQGFQRIHLSPGARTAFDVTDGATLAD
jgi:beta-glucosidase